MSSSLPLSLHAEVTPVELAPTEFEVVATEGKVVVRGHLTAGSLGWRLRAEAACRRSTITVNVTAIETNTKRMPDLEHHRYEATIQVRRPGRYALRVAHVYKLRGQDGVAPERPVFEHILTVP